MPNRFNPPSARVLRWLTDPGPDVPAELHGVLLAQLLAEPVAVVMGVVNGIVVNVAALLLHYERWFVFFLVIDSFIAVARLAVIRMVNQAVRSGRPAPMDLYVVMAILWCALQGAVAFTALKSDCQPLQIIATSTALALIGPIAARNYPAPRLGFLLVALCLLPFVAGALLSGEAPLWIYLLQTPFLLYGTHAILLNYRNLAVAARKAELDSQRRAQRDPLTGLLNRRGFDEAELRYQAVTEPFSVFCLDLDGFKKVNDSLGHPAGDALLQAVGRRLEAGVRPTETLIRLGGDEFVILAPGMPAAVAEDLAARLINRVAGEPYLLDGRTLVRIGLSVGFACAPEDGDSLTLLHRRADAALYVAKADGKGVHRRHQPDADPVPSAPHPPAGGAPEAASAPCHTVQPAAASG